MHLGHRKKNKGSEVHLDNTLLLRSDILLPNPAFPVPGTLFCQVI